MQRWWLQQMRSPKWRLHEKMTLFWHDHFPSSYNVVFELDWIATQNATVPRARASGTSATSSTG